MTLPIAFNDNLSFNSKRPISVKKFIGHTTGISTRFEYLGWKSNPTSSRATLPTRFCLAIPMF